MDTLSTVVVGLVVAYITWQQWKLAHNQLRLDLFDRRYRVFEAARQFLAAIQAESTFGNDTLSEFDKVGGEAAFLFGADIVAYLSAIRDKAINMRLQQRLYEPMADGPERVKHIQAERDELGWLCSQITLMPSQFAPYLSFAQIRVKAITN
jgi:hypothetical protein